MHKLEHIIPKRNLVRSGDYITSYHDEILERAIKQLEEYVVNVENCGNCAQSNCCQSCQRCQTCQTNTCQSCQTCQSQSNRLIYGAYDFGCKQVVNIYKWEYNC